MKRARWVVGNGRRKPPVVVTGSEIVYRNASELPTGKVGGFSAAAGGTSYGAIGPFTGCGYLQEVGYVLGSSASSTVRVSMVLAYVGEATRVAFEAGSDLFMPGATDVDGRAALLVQSFNGGSIVHSRIPLFVPVRTGAVWVLGAVFNGGAVNFRFTFNALFGRFDTRVGGDDARA